MYLPITSHAAHPTASILDTQHIPITNTSEAVDNLAMRVQHGFLPTLNPFSGHETVDIAHLVNSMTGMMTQVDTFCTQDKMKKENKEKKKDDEKLVISLGNKVIKLRAIMCGEPNPKNSPCTSGI